MRSDCNHPHGMGYKIDTDGNVYGKSGNKLKLHTGGNNNYLQASFSQKSKVIKVLVHRLVALTFLDNPLNKSQVNHKDGDVSNNKIDNLEWVTPEENMLHSYHTLGNVKGTVPMQGKFGADHNRSKNISIKTPEGMVLNFESISLMSKATGYSNTAVSWATTHKRLPYIFTRGKNKGMTILSFDIKENYDEK